MPEGFSKSQEMRAHLRIRKAEDQLEKVFHAALWRTFNDVLSANDVPGLPSQGMVAALRSPDDLGLLLTRWGQEVDGGVTAALKSVFLRTAYDTVKGVSGRLGYTLPLGPNIRDVRAGEYLASAKNRLVGIGETAFREASVTLRESLDSGEGVPKAARRVRESLNTSIKRATTIARTEAGAAVNGADHAVSLDLAEAGIVTARVWLATTDARTRETHRAANGQRVDVDKPFKVGGHDIMYPGAPGAPADEVINCRCTTLLDIAPEQEAPKPVPEADLVEVAPVGSPELQASMRTAERERERMFRGRFSEAGNIDGTNGYTPGSDGTYEALKQYTEGLAAPLNKLLRDRPTTLSDQDEFDLLLGSRMETLLAKNTLDSDITVARGMTGNFSHLKNGEVFSDKAWLSTTSDLKEAQNFAAGRGRGKAQEGWTFIIQAKKGTNALPGADYQKEIVFGPNTKQAILRVDEATRTVYTQIKD